MKRIIISILCLFLINEANAWYKMDGDKLFNQDAGSSPFNQCEGNCAGAKPCCRYWTLRSKDKIGHLVYYDYVCDSWEAKWHYLPAIAKYYPETCLKYEIVKDGPGYTNECKEWRYYKGDIRIIDSNNSHATPNCKKHNNI